MKALTLIPKKIKDIYKIEKTKTSLNIHEPAFVNINFDDQFIINNNDIWISIYNSKCVVTLWKKVFGQHITIFN